MVSTWFSLAIDVSTVTRWMMSCYLLGLFYELILMMFFACSGISSVVLTLTMLLQKENSLHLYRPRRRLIIPRLSWSLELTFLGLLTRYSMICMTDMSQSTSPLWTIALYQQWVGLGFSSWILSTTSVCVLRFEYYGCIITYPFIVAELRRYNTLRVHSDRCAEHVYPDNWEGNLSYLEIYRL